MLVIDVPSTGANIRRLMSAAGKSVLDVADACGGLTKMSIYKWFYGHALPSIDNLVVLADYLGVTIDEVLITKRI